MVLDVRGIELSPEEAADRLGYELFDEDADLKAKFALGSSVARLPDGLRVFVKSIGGLDGDAGRALGQMLKDAWVATGGTFPATAVSHDEMADEALQVPVAVSADKR